MNTPFDFSESAEQAIVYVRQVNTSDLPRELREQVGDIDTLYAVHNTEGERLALVRDRKMAFALAIQNDLVPVTVH